MSGKFRPARKLERLDNCLEDRPGEIEVAVKMRPRYARTKRPRGALLQLGPALGLKMYSIGGRLRSTVKYHPSSNLMLTLTRNPGKRQGLVGSLTGAVACKRVTQAFKGSLTTDGNRSDSAKA